jgi:hypothetical protein
MLKSVDPLAQSRNRVRVRRKARELRDRLTTHRNVRRAARTTTSAAGSNLSAGSSALDRLVDGGLVTPALVTKRQRQAPSITADGTVSDPVTEQRR